MTTQLQRARREARDPWTELLLRCRERHGEGSQLYGTLLGLRCFGVRVDRGHLVPPADYEEWAEDRERYLVPHREDLIALLKEGRS